MQATAARIEFLSALNASIVESRFVKLVLTSASSAEEGLKQVHVRPILVKRQPKLSFTYRYQTRDIVKNYSADEAQEHCATLLGQFRQATLCTTSADWRYDATGKHTTLAQSPASHAQPDMSHDRQKQRPVDASRPFLSALRITDAKGTVFKNAQDKYRQINKYVETLAGLVGNLPIRRVADMGSGKGYLTFALYDYLTHTLKRDVEVTGVEYRADMVVLCNEVARQCGYGGLKFVQGSIADYDSTGIDLLIALHACDTATDDAIAKGIHGGAQLIVVAPCCHKQIRREMDAATGTAPDLDFLLRHGTFMEREAEMVTDGLRALYLEAHGYSTKLFEFISNEHTPKNVMLVGVKNKKAGNAEVLKKINAAKQYFGIRQHYLETLLP